MNNATIALDNLDTTLAASRKAPTPRADMEMARMRETATNFEAMFLGQMLQPMFQGIETNGMFGGGHAEKVWRGLLVDEMGKEIAKSGGIGIADAVMRQMISMQEASGQ